MTFSSFKLNSELIKPSKNNKKFKNHHDSTVQQPTFTFMIALEPF